MDKLNKAIKRLDEKSYQHLLSSIANSSNDHPYVVLESARHKNLEDKEMIQVLQVNRSTYYTIKSRLYTKVASILSKEIENPIGVLMEKVAKVRANLFGSNRQITIVSLTDLEKELIRYDLSSELIVVYKALSLIHIHGEKHDHYQKLHDKHVAFSLAVSKAEDLFYRFNKMMGQYLLTRNESDLEIVKKIRRELSNIHELYDSHRLFVFNNITRIHFWCLTPRPIGWLRSKEVEIETILEKVRKIIGENYLDTFYQNIKALVDCLYFTYYTKIENMPRAEHYNKKLAPDIPALAKKYFMTFYIIQFLESKIQKFLLDGNKDSLSEINKALEDNLDIEENETYHYVAYQRFLAVAKFYEGDFAASAKIIYNIRNELSLVSFPYFEAECKLFQALQYSLIGEEDLCLHNVGSIVRKVGRSHPVFEQVRLFSRLLRSTSRQKKFKVKLNHIKNLWSQFEKKRNPEFPLLWFLDMDESVMNKIAEPVK